MQDSKEQVRLKKAAANAKQRAYQKKYRAANAEKHRAYQKQYNAANAEKIRERQQQYNAANAEKRRQREAANAEKLREQKQRYNAANVEKIRERKQRYNAANAAKVHKQYRQHRAQDPKGTWLKAAYRSALARAKKRGLPYDDKPPPDLELPDVCPVLGIALRYLNGTGKFSPDSPSLDRVKPSLGYVAGNLRVISFRANTLKNNAAVDELRAVVRYMEAVS